MRTHFECDMENQRLVEKGIVFVCPNQRCQLRVLCPFTARDVLLKEGQTTKEGGAK